MHSRTGRNNREGKAPQEAAMCGRERPVQRALDVDTDKREKLYKSVFRKAM